MNKLMSLDEVAGQITDGSTIAVGGSSLSRKPMAMIRALARAGRRNLRLIVDVGGPDVDLLVGCGVVSEVIYAFVGFEVLGLAPHFRRARQQASVSFQEWSEYTIMAGLDATIKRVPFLPTHTGLATDLLEVNPAFKAIVDPFGGETLIAVPALVPDFALIHVNYADVEGNGLILGDSHVDRLCAKAARTTFMSCEAVVTSQELRSMGRDIQILRIHTDGVIEARWGAHPTMVAPDYRFDLEALSDYLAHAADADRWTTYQSQVIGIGHDQYLNRLGGASQLAQRLAVLETRNGIRREH